jgi:hypothetical protein
MSPTGAGVQDHDGRQGDEMMAMCPMGVADTQVAYQETPDGAALRFITQRGDVLELRRRVTAMVDMVNMHQGSGHGDMHGSGQGMGGPGTATYGDVEGGAQVLLTPTDPDQLSRLRTEVQSHAARMAAGDCPMMGGGPGESGGAGHGSHHE